MKTTKREVDVAVLGAGTAGMAAYRAVVKTGKRVVLVEAGPYGTTCARVGCMPSKLLIAAADTAHHVRDAAPFGITATIAIDGKAVMARVKRERDRFVGFVVDSVESFPEEDRVKGRAHFTGPNDLRVENGDAETTVTAKTFVIATGSTPFVPTMFDAIRDRVLVNDHVFDLDDLPTSLAVFGAGVIGLELGQAFHRLGTKVRIFGVRGTVGPLSDIALKKVAAEVFKEELAVDFDSKVMAVTPGPDAASVVVRWTDADGNERSETFAHALIAAGRRPNLHSLGLENTGVDAMAVVDRETLRLGSTHVFIAGDVTTQIPLLHEAADEGTIAGANAAGWPDVSKGKRRSQLGIAFTDPEIAIVGGGYPAAERQGPYATGQVDFSDQGRSRIMRQNKGMGHLYASPKTRRFLGAELVGPRAEHLGHLLAWSLQAELTIDQMLAMPFYHPVVEEGLRTALRDVVAKLRGEGR